MLLTFLVCSLCLKPKFGWEPTQAKQAVIRSTHSSQVSPNEDLIWDDVNQRYVPWVFICALGDVYHPVPAEFESWIPKRDQTYLKEEHEKFGVSAILARKGNEGVAWKAVRAICTRHHLEIVNLKHAFVMTRVFQQENISLLQVQELTDGVATAAWDASGRRQSPLSLRTDLRPQVAGVQETGKRTICLVARLNVKRGEFQEIFEGSRGDQWANPSYVDTDRDGRPIAAFLFSQPSDKRQGKFLVNYNLGRSVFKSYSPSDVQQLVKSGRVTRAPDGFDDNDVVRIRVPLKDGGYDWKATVVFVSGRARIEKEADVAPDGDNRPEHIITLFAPRGSRILSISVTLLDCRVANWLNVPLDPSRG